MSKNKIVDLHPNLDNLHAYINSVIKVYGFVDNVNELGRETLGMPIIHYALRDKTISRTSSKIMSVVNTLAEFGDLDTPYERNTPISYAIKDKNAIGVAALVLGEYQDRYVVPELSTDYLVLALTEGNDDIVKIIYKGMVRRGQDVLFNKDEIDPFMVPTMSREIWDMIYMNMEKRIKDIDEYPEQIQAYFKDAEDRRRKIIEQNQGRIHDINTALVVAGVRINDSDDDDDDEDYVPSDEEDSDEYYTDEEEDDGSELEDNDEDQWRHKYVVKGPSDGDVSDERLEYLYKTRIGRDEVPDEHFEYGRIDPGVYSVMQWEVNLAILAWNNKRSLSPFPYLEPLSDVSHIYSLLNRNVIIYEDETREMVRPEEMDWSYNTSFLTYHALSEFVGLPFRDYIVMTTRFFVYNRDIHSFARAMLYLLFKQEIDGFDEIYEDAWQYCQDAYKVMSEQPIEGTMVGGARGIPLATAKKYLKSPGLTRAKQPVSDHFERDTYRSIKCVYDLNIGKYPDITYDDIEEILVMNDPKQFIKFVEKFSDFDEQFVKGVLSTCKKNGRCEGNMDMDEDELMNGNTMTFEHLCQAVMDIGSYHDDAAIGYKVHLALKNGANDTTKINIIYPYKHNINIGEPYKIEGLPN
jgi:hypothetical protein